MLNILLRIYLFVAVITSEVNQIGYTTWVFKLEESSRLTENSITVKVVKTGGKGGGLTTNWYKEGVQALVRGKWVNDGVTVKEGIANKGRLIELRISGLADGNHTIIAFLNAVDSPTTNTFSPMNISIDDVFI